MMRARRRGARMEFERVWHGGRRKTEDRHSFFHAAHLGSAALGLRRTCASSRATFFARLGGGAVIIGTPPPNPSIEFKPVKENFIEQARSSDGDHFCTYSLT